MLLSHENDTLVLYFVLKLIAAREEYAKPHITAHPDDMTALVGNNVTLHCGANSSVDSDMIFTWKRNNNRLILDNVIIKQYASAQNDGIAQFSDLLLIGVSMSNAGTYQCVVSNSYGVAYSKLSQLSVLGV